jgi:sugar phosphate isomerase/epimerase
MRSSTPPWVPSRAENSTKACSYRRNSFSTRSSAVTALLYDGSMAERGIRLGYDAYSLRAWRWKALEHLEYSAKLKLDTIQFSGLGDYESLDPAHLEKVKQKARELDITIDAGTGCICPTSTAWNPKNGDPVKYLSQALRVAKAVGSTSVRCFLGSSADRLTPGGIERHIEATVKVFRGCRSLALDLGVKIAIENHSGDMQAWETKMLIEEAGADYVGACLDAGNPIWAIEDPIVAMEVLGPLTLTTHVRDTAIYEHPRGAAAQWTAMGDGSVDFKKFVELHRKLCPNASMQLEIITGRPPRVIPYLEDDFWKAFPKARASEFARFVELVKRGKPFSGSMIIADVPGAKPPEYVEALKAQQRLDLERSLEYCKRTLGAGLHGKG